MHRTLHRCTTTAPRHGGLSSWRLQVKGSDVAVSSRSYPSRALAFQACRRFLHNALTAAITT
ncbi:hypothetical protein AB0A74_00710 [Saccharothrix sp. NPDC042600]|uniref:hypothetical protein n=1 Tax=Saccharothrix TaxID=2071 RepID=UPI00340E028F|nr:hypothetical protein GCM10017745_48350 [Saccharothrix mutabilis subsp. capreolus]